MNKDSLLKLKETCTEKCKAGLAKCKAGLAKCKGALTKDSGMLAKCKAGLAKCRDGLPKFVRQRKGLVTALALTVVAIVAVGVTLTYLSNSSGELVNIFSPSKVGCEIVETVSGGVKSSVQVKNTGKAAAYVRVAVIANTVDGDGNITGAADVSSHLTGKGWVQSGLYYYYTSAVEANAQTGELLSSSIVLSGIQVTILAEAIQAEPEGAAQEAWGVSPASLAKK